MRRLAIIETKVVNGLLPLVRFSKRYGDQVTLFTTDLSYYLRNNEISESELRQSIDVVKMPFRNDGFAAIRNSVLDHAQAFSSDALFTLSEPHVVLAASLARTIGLRHCSPEAAELARSKYKTRMRMAEHGVCQPDFETVQEMGQIKVAIERLGLPVIVKPVDGFGSRLITKANSVEAVTSAASQIFCNQSHGRGIEAQQLVLLETFLEGPIVSAEVLSFSGKHKILGFTDRLPFAGNSFGERGGCFPASFQGERAAHQIVLRALDAIGFTDGATHVEICLSGDGPKIIEINCRLAGFFVPELIEAAIGIDPYNEVANIHAGIEPKTTPNKNQIAHIRAIFAQRSGVITRLSPTQASLIQDVRMVQLFRGVGDKVDAEGDNHTRIGAVIASNSDELAGASAADSALSSIDIEIAPSH